MSDASGDQPGPADDPADDPALESPGGGDALSQEARRRRRARVFGDVLPDRTGDERDDGSERSPGGADEWLRRQVPPHHG